MNCIALEKNEGTSYGFLSEQKLPSFKQNEFNHCFKWESFSEGVINDEHRVIKDQPNGNLVAGMVYVQLYENSKYMYMPALIDTVVSLTTFSGYFF